MNFLKISCHINLGTIIGLLARDRKKPSPTPISKNTCDFSHNKKLVLLLIVFVEGGGVTLHLTTLLKVVNQPIVQSRSLTPYKKQYHIVLEKEAHQ